MFKENICNQSISGGNKFVKRKEKIGKRKVGDAFDLLSNCVFRWEVSCERCCEWKFRAEGSLNGGCLSNDDSVTFLSNAIHLSHVRQGWVPLLRLIFLWGYYECHRSKFDIQCSEWC